MEKIDDLKSIIAEKVFIKNLGLDAKFFFDPKSTWIFDFRNILMNGGIADRISEIFYESYKDKYPFQLCALEIAGVPLVTSIMTKFYARGVTDINAFFIRKSRKKTGTLRMIEGSPDDTKEIILVDDLMNKGNSFWKQIEILESLGYKVTEVWSILRFRDISYYKRFHNRNIKVTSLFDLNDFYDELQLENLPENVLTETPIPFTAEWTFQSANPSYHIVAQKSQPILDGDLLYVGSDNEYFYALHQDTGKIAWRFRVASYAKQKAIFSNPIICDDTVIFGSHDGNLYALDKMTGEKRWIFFEADYIGSSPTYSRRDKCIFIGMEFGMWGGKGGIVAIDCKTGKKIWSDYTHGARSESSPLYIEKYNQVIIGSHDGVVRLYNASTGVLQWAFTTVGGSLSKLSEKSDTCALPTHIKGGFAYDHKTDRIMFGTTDGFFYVLNRKNGDLVKHYACMGGIFSTPYIYVDKVYFTSVDKHLRCIDLCTLEILFEINIDNTRIFSDPIVINKKLYVGTNAAQLHELDPKTGKEVGYFQTRERITNTIIYNSHTDTFFLPTFANEIIALKRTTTPAS